MSYDSANTVLDIYTKEIKSVSQRDICSPKFNCITFHNSLDTQPT